MKKTNLFNYSAPDSLIHSLCLVLFMCLLVPVTGGAASDELSPAVTASESADFTNHLTVAEIEAQIATVQAATNLTEATRQNIIGYYTNAITSIQRRDAALEHAQEFEEVIQDLRSGESNSISLPWAIGQRAAELKAKAMSISEVENRIARMQMQLAVAESKLQSDKSSAKESYDAPEVLVRKIDSYQKRLNYTETSLKTLSDSETATPLLRARLKSLQAQYNALRAELQSLQIQLELVRTKSDKLQTSQSGLMQQVRTLQDSIALWNGILEKRRNNIAFIGLRQSLAALRKINEPEWPARADFLTSIASNNIALSRQIIEIEDRVSTASSLADSLQSDLDTMQNDYEMTQKRMMQMGLTREAGDLLRTRRASLQLLRSNSNDMTARRDLIMKLNLKSDDILQARQGWSRFREENYTAT